MTLGARLRRARLAAGIGMGELAQRAGTTRMSVWRIEDGRQSPTADRLADLARALEVSTDWLLGLNDGSPREAHKPD